MAPIRKRIPGLMVILLILTLTGQAAAVFVTPCRGTAPCCCQPLSAEMGMPGSMATGMGRDTRPSCCETTPSLPCDIASDIHPARFPFMVSASVDRLDGYAASGHATLPTFPIEIAFYSLNDGLVLTSRGGPPLHLLIQTFLC